MESISTIAGYFFIFGLMLLILSYANKIFTQRPNKTFLLLGLLFFLMWITLFIITFDKEILK